MTQSLSFLAASSSQINSSVPNSCPSCNHSRPLYISIRQTAVMLCAACGSIDFAKFRPPGFVVQDHHASYADICQAASGGCELCQLIVEANDKRSQEHYNNRKPPDWVKIEELRSSNQIECYMYSANGLPKSIYGPYSEIVFTHRNSGEDSWKKFFYINLRCYTKYGMH